jgi:hypothetical protein
MMTNSQTIRSTADNLRALFGLGWVVILVLVVAPWLWLATEEQKPPAHRTAEAAVSAVHALWADDRYLDAVWAEQARQWNQDYASSDFAGLPSQRTWSDLNQAALALQEGAVQVLQVQSIQKAYELLELHTSTGHPEIRRLAQLLQSRMQSLLSKPIKQGNIPTVALTWGNLESVVDDLNHIQIHLTEIRRWSMSVMMPSDFKLPMRFYVQMSMAFPSVNVRQFESQAFLLIKSRLAIQNAIAQAQLLQLKQMPVEPTPVSPLRWWVAVICALVSVGWMFVLGRGLSNFRYQHSQLTDEVDTLNKKIQEAKFEGDSLEPEAVATTIHQPATESLWASQVRAALPDVLGRVKNIKRLFDSGHSQEMVARDLSIVEAKLVQWDRSSNDSPIPPSGP